MVLAADPHKRFWWLCFIKLNKLRKAYIGLA